MSEHPISLAFETFDRTPSDAFRQQLRSEFLAGLAPQEVSDANEADNTVTVIEAIRPPQRRLQLVLGVAAAIAIVAALDGGRPQSPFGAERGRDRAATQRSPSRQSFHRHRSESPGRSLINGTGSRRGS